MLLGTKVSCFFLFSIVAFIKVPEFGRLFLELPRFSGRLNKATPFHMQALEPTIQGAEPRMIMEIIGNVCCYVD